jgi:hypothetical protein
MKHIKTRFLAFCGLLILAAAAVAPITMAGCPNVIVDCGDGRTKMCSGTSNGSGGCVYKESCLTC